MILNKLLDASIYYSFDQSGFLRHQQSFKNQWDWVKDGRALVTGGTSGLGKATAEHLTGQGIETWITGRDPKKAESFISPLIHFTKLDMADWTKIASTIEKLPQLDYLVLNAGGMPESFQQNVAGVELQFASQLFGHYILLKKLYQAGKLKSQARVVWVTSGGMYLKPLDLSTIYENPKYEKASTYANVKRAQVTLLNYFKQEFPGLVITAMHPGWADTPGVKSAIPGFYEKLKDRLRTPEQGADTIIWLLGTAESIESGQFYFDRKPVSHHLFWFTKSSDRKADALYQMLQEHV